MADGELDRRDALRACALLGVACASAAALAGCGATAPAPAPSRAPVVDGELATTAQIPVGGGTVFADRSVVVTQPMAGVFKAFSATCTHAGCTVGGVQAGLIVCPCHHSEFSIVDGSVRGGPAPDPLPAVPITVANGRISTA